MNNSNIQASISFFKNMLSMTGDRNYSKVMTGLQFSVPVPYLDFLDDVRI